MMRKPGELFEIDGATALVIPREWVTAAGVQSGESLLVVRDGNRLIVERAGDVRASILSAATAFMDAHPTTLSKLGQ
jgi:bifunctional DNA-binding transcriptional regulator/antitoxin component of YhaV-PrlF toxin-antitoxin module